MIDLCTHGRYARTLQRHFMTHSGWSPYFIIDTSRNGAEIVRPDCHGWCNLRGAGLGHAPTMNTGLADVVDAFWWIKTPGESDGYVPHPQSFTPQGYTHTHTT